MKLGISIALNGPSPVALRILAYYGLIEVPGVDLVLHAVGSSKEDRKAAQENGWAYSEAPNDNLGAKRNAGLQALRELGAEHVVRIGADDMLSPALLGQMAEHLATGATGVVVRGSFILDEDTKECIECYRIDYALGIGADVLDKHDWRLYEETGRAAPDRMISAYIAGRACARVASTPDAWFLQIKSAANINTFERIKAREIWRPAALPMDATPDTESEKPTRKRKAKPAAPETAADSGTETED